MKRVAVLQGGHPHALDEASIPPSQRLRIARYAELATTTNSDSSSAMSTSTDWNVDRDILVDWMLKKSPLASSPPCLLYDMIWLDSLQLECSLFAWSLKGIHSSLTARIGIGRSRRLHISSRRIWFSWIITLFLCLWTQPQVVMPTLHYIAILHNHLVLVYQEYGERVWDGLAHGVRIIWSCLLCQTKQIGRAYWRCGTDQIY